MIDVGALVAECESCWLDLTIEFASAWVMSWHLANPLGREPMGCQGDPTTTWIDSPVVSPPPAAGGIGWIGQAPFWPSARPALCGGLVTIVASIIAYSLSGSCCRRLEAQDGPFAKRRCRAQRAKSARGLLHQPPRRSGGPRATEPQHGNSRSPHQQEADRFSSAVRCYKLTRRTGRLSR